MPDATTLLKFRCLLQDNDLPRALSCEINAHLAQQALLTRVGSVVDAAIVAAPSATKTEDKARDTEMHQTKKGNQWTFGMKAHIGLDAESGLVPTVVGTAAKVNDLTQAAALLHGEETEAFAGDDDLLAVVQTLDAPARQTCHEGDRMRPFRPVSRHPSRPRQRRWRRTA